ncbi:MAG: MFS transporter, partial [Alphaproteobacteria bacterium]|nr:MFS transporter [Alphaproteobacteria bacterium]
GAMVTAVAVANLSLNRKTGLLMFGAVAFYAVCTIAFGVSANFGVSLAALVLLGAADQISVITRNTVVQLATPADMRGRVSALHMLFVGTSNELGQFRAGTFAGWLGTVPAVVLGGVGTLAVVALWSWLFPELRRLDRVADLEA